MGMTLSVLDAARECPCHDAVVFGERVLSYRELAEQVRSLLFRLESAGALGDDKRPIALVARTGLPEVVAIHAFMELRRPWLALHDRLTPAERERLLRLAGAGWLIDGDTLVAVADGSGALGIGPETLALIPTSGTTGQPKLAMLSRAAFMASAAASSANMGWQPNDRWLLCMPLAHVGGVSVLTRCLLARRCVVVTASPRFDAERLIAEVESARVSLMSVVPTMLLRLLEREPRWDPPAHLRAILLGGAAAPARLLERADDRRWPVLTTYGLTEACSQVTTQEYGTRQRGEAGAGQVLAGVEVKVAGGQILVRGATMMSGYLGEREALDEDGWFQTGDCGAWDEHGNLHVVGRATDMIVTGGENVHPVEVEQVLEDCPGVRAACVFGVPDEEWGQVVAAAVAGDVAAVDVAGFARSRLASYKRPRLLSVARDLAWTASGKLDRKSTASAAMSRGLSRLST